MYKNDVPTETYLDCLPYQSTALQSPCSPQANALVAPVHPQANGTVSEPQSGFTLIELLTTLAIATLILTMAAPSFTTMIQNNRLTTQTNQFVSAMTLARSEAIKRRANINVVAIDSSVTGDEWGPGWNVVIDGGATLRIFAALEGSSTLNSNGNINTYQYQPSGRANTADTLSLCDERSNETGRLISLAATGRVSVVPQTCP